MSCGLCGIVTASVFHTTSMKCIMRSVAYKIEKKLFSTMHGYSSIAVGGTLLFNAISSRFDHKNMSFISFNVLYFVNAATIFIYNEQN